MDGKVLGESLLLLRCQEGSMQCGLPPPDVPYAFRAQTGMAAPVQQVSTPGSSPPMSKDGVLRLRILRDWILNPMSYCPAQRGLEALEVGGANTCHPASRFRTYNSSCAPCALLRNLPCRRAVGCAAR